MDNLLEFLIPYANLSHYIIFIALMLAGLNVPLSEDLLIICGGILAATVVPENTYLLFAAIFLGSYLSDWEAYWIGRLLGPKLWHSRWFSSMVSKKSVEKVNRFYQRYGFSTLLVGRFIPFGVRNCLFLTAGLSKMSFLRFLISDGIACIISNITLFYLAFKFGKNYPLLINYLEQFHFIIFSIFLLIIISLTISYIFKRQFFKGK